ncbi:MAG: hypothetical protein OES34_09560 [Nitrosopumilus sp.]|nr:hypothetical protein [Nitrosopumilus sp.]
MSFTSVHDMLTPPKIIRKQRFWDFFDGDSLRSWWAQRDVAGTGTFAMQATVDDGFRITTGSTSGNNSLIDFNDAARHYSHIGSIFIGNMRSTSVTDHYTITGLTEQGASPSDTRYNWKNDSTISFMSMGTAVNSSSTNVSSSITPDTNFHKVAAEAKSASVIGWVDDILEAISTANLPDVALQPIFRQGTRSDNAKGGRIKYIEAYNT